MGDHERSAPEPAHPTPAGGELSERRIKRRQAIRMLELDALAIEVISTLAACGVQSILLKGPVLARALYDDGAPRPYRDCDILVPEGRLADAGAALLAAGFACDFDERDAHALLDPHAQYWTRPPSRLIVDLHWTFDGVRAEPEVLWSDFAHGSAVMQFHNTAVRTPARSRIALLVALHAARHGREIAKPLEDLRRALERFESGVWEEAGRLATRLGAIDAFVAGLSLVAEGDALATTLGLSANPGTELSVRLQQTPRGAGAIARVLDTDGLGGRTRALSALVFPPVSYMRYSFPLARRGTAGLLGAYAQRLLRRAPQVPAAVRAIRAINGAERTPPADRRSRP